MLFPVVLHSDDGRNYGVTVPDLPGCFSAGESMEAAIARAGEAIGLHLDGLAEDGEVLPVPQGLAAHQDKPEFAGGIWALVAVDMSRFDGKAQKINITVPRNVLARIDAFAAAHGATRSRFLVEAACRAMRAG